MATLALIGQTTSKTLVKNGSFGILYIKTAPYCTDRRPNLATYKRGTGGRSSFNGIVATVFGATGFVSRYVCNKLGKIGTQLILPYRSDYYDAQRLKVCGDLGQVIFTPYDIRDEESIRKAVRYSNVVINLVGRDYETKNFKYMDVHVHGPRMIARISREMGVQRFIHLSYLNQGDRKPGNLIRTSVWSTSKHIGEEAVRAEFPTATIFRASDIYGSEDRFTKVFSSAWRTWGLKVPVYAAGMKTLKQPVFVSDVAQGIVNAIKDNDTQAKIYQAVGPRQYLLADLVDWFFGLMRKDERWGYKRYDIKYDPAFPAKVKIANLCSLAYPWGALHWEGLEKESTTDVVSKDLPTLLDLGVRLTPIEEMGPWLFKPYRLHNYYDHKIGEFPDPRPPKIHQGLV